MAGPLAGIRIVDLTQMISGPMATMILADQGAEVIKVEPPGSGDLTRALGGRRHGMSPTFAVANRNKRSVVIDLKQPNGVELLKRLVARADLMVQNFRPGTVERMGIGESAMRAVKPDLIYVSISGFGESQGRMWKSIRPSSYCKRDSLNLDQVASASFSRAARDTLFPCLPIAIRSPTPLMTIMAPAMASAIHHWSH